MSCPFTNLKSTPLKTSKIALQECPFHKHKANYDPSKVKSPPQLTLRGGTTHIISQGSIDLLEDIGGGDVIREICTRFYARAFEDAVLKQFFFLDDGAVAHAQRLADWIIEKMGGEGRPWTESGRLGQRQPSHFKAWNSDKRHYRARGDHFKLDDVRIWMRLHFWAVRECGLTNHKPFFTWYKQFIGHFSRVYERQAPAYTEESARWSENDSNLVKYMKLGNFMEDVVDARARPFPPYNGEALKSYNQTT